MSEKEKVYEVTLHGSKINEEDRMKVLCKNCGKRFGIHSTSTDRCPSDNFGYEYQSETIFEPVMDLLAAYREMRTALESAKAGYDVSHDYQMWSSTTELKVSMKFVKEALEKYPEL